MATNDMAKNNAAALVIILALVPTAFAVIYSVGGASQWDSGVDYTEWVKGKTFRVGDILEFKYGPSHSLSVIDEAAYDSCDGSSASELHSDGDTRIELKTVGPKFFLCPTPGHCVNGMKLTVTVVASPSSPPTSTSPPPTIPVTPPISTSSPPPFPVVPPPTSTSPPPSLPVASPPTAKGLPPPDGTHEPGWGSNTLPPPPTPSPPPPSNSVSSGLISYVVVVKSLVLACNLWIN